MQFKTRINSLQSQIRKLSGKLKRAQSLEKHSRKKWTIGYNKFKKAALDLTTLKNHGTNREARLKERIRGWENENIELTKKRDQYRAEIQVIQDELLKLEMELTRLSDQQNSEASAEDEIVTTVFALNEVTVRASQDRENCLKRHVFPRLMDGDKLLSQVSFTSSDGLRRVVGMVNNMVIVRGDMATEAMAEINRFFERVQKTTMDSNAKALYDLTKQLLVEKTTFKVGPDLYRFLGMKLNAKVFPELSLAQDLLRRSIRSERTNSYVRIFERSNRTEKWTPRPPVVVYDPQDGS